jgi:hypothetical protein
MIDDIFLYITILVLLGVIYKKRQKKEYKIYVKNYQELTHPGIKDCLVNLIEAVRNRIEKI